MKPKRENDQEINIVREEMNLCEFPIGTLTYKKALGKSLFFQDAFTDKETGAKIEKKWLVDGSVIHGVPIAPDDDILLGLRKITDIQKKKTINFTKYELFKSIKWPVNKNSYEYLIESLFRIGSCKITTTNSFWLKGEKKLGSLTFSIADNFMLYGKKTGNPQTDMHFWDIDFISWTWGDVLWKSFQDGYLKQTDLNFYASLKWASSKRLYRFADKLFNNGNKVKKTIRVLCCEHLGMSRTYDGYELKRELKKATDELEKKGYILKPVYLNFKQYLRDNNYYLRPGYDAEKDTALKDFIVLEPAPKKLLVSEAGGHGLPTVLRLPAGQEKVLDACGLVTHFLTKMMHKREPMAKEIIQAQELISKYGDLKAKKIIDYAVLKVMEAFSEPTEYFGGILIYEERALGRIENEEKRIKSDEEQKQKEDAESEMFLAEESAHAKIKAVIELLSAKERAELEAEAKRNLLDQGKGMFVNSPLTVECESLEIIKKRLQKKES